MGVSPGLEGARVSGAFRTELGRRTAAADASAAASHRRWLFIPGDQLSDRIGPLSREPADTLGILLIESEGEARARPWHRQRLALLWANQRHFALEQAARGVAVRYRIGAESTGELLEEEVAALRAQAGGGTHGGAADGGPAAPLRAMEPAERLLRLAIQPLVVRGDLELLPHEGWLTPPDALEQSQKGAPWRMDAFYRWVRRHTGILMEGGKPVGGRFSFDSENREPWPGDPPAAVEPTFPVDAVKAEVIDRVQTLFPDHPGTLRPEALPATRDEALALWSWAQRDALPHFGPYEDAMSERSTTLFHTRISALVNLHRILPREVVDDALTLDLPLATLEGFIRQVIGWREFVRHVHRATDGFRTLPAGTPVAEWGAAPSALDAHAPLPPAWWGTRSGLRCLDVVVDDVWREGYSHHITRLMVLSNLATLLALSPRELTDWFWVAYTDAWDWVVEPNVLGMGTFAVGDLMMTKPYVSGAAYIDRMGDFCAGCAFDPKSTCPITPLYWAFLERNRGALTGNPRMSLPLASAAKRAPGLRERDAQVFEVVRARLAAGERVRPGDLPGPPGRG